MLGHRDIKTTLIYAKIVDEAKRKTTERIKLDFNSRKEDNTPRKLEKIEKTRPDEILGGRGPARELFNKKQNVKV
jgi:hypothetical protein